MIVTHTINVDVEINESTAPASIIHAFKTMPKPALDALLTETFIHSINETDALSKINANNSYATVKWGKN
jgi:hypothetical protein